MGGRNDYYEKEKVDYGLIIIDKFEIYFIVVFSFVLGTILGFSVAHIV